MKILFIVYDIKGNLDFEFNSYIQTEENNERIESIDKYTDSLAKLNEKGIISKYQMAKSLKEYIQKNRIDIAISEEQLNRLKLEEEHELLEAYKKMGKNAPQPNNENSFASEFGEDFGEDLGEDFGEGQDIEFSSPEGETSGESIEQNEFDFE